MKMFYTIALILAAVCTMVCSSAAQAEAAAAAADACAQSKRGGARVYGGAGAAGSVALSRVPG